MDIDFGQAYRFAREEIARLVEGRDDTVIVPATPLWSLHDVVAHLAGVVEDGRIGNFEGAPGDAWTAAQVLRGATNSTAQLLAEWAEGAPSLEEALTAGTGPWHSTLDVVTHLCDLANAVGVPAHLPPRISRGGLAASAAGFRIRHRERGVRASHPERHQLRDLPSSLWPTHPRRGAGDVLVA